jgi:hypothetical protein
MGANPKQALGLLLFLAAFVLIAAGVAGGGVLWIVVGLALLAASAAVFIKAKPLEHIDG